MNFLLDVNNVDISAPIENFGDAVLYGGQMLLLGILTVFSVLTLLWIALVGFKFFFHDLALRKKKKEVKNESAQAPQASAVADSNEIIAVIAAAIAMAESESGGNKSFRVVSFKRK